MAYDKNTLELNMERSAEGGQDTEASSGTVRSGHGTGGAVLLVLCLLFLAVGIFLMYSDMKRDVRHGVCRCEDERMMELPVEPDREKITLASEGIAAAAAAHPEIGQYMMLIPSSACVQSGYLPANIDIRDQAADLSMVRGAMPAALSWIDLLDLFSRHSGEKLYYATDVYLTGWGSRYAANAALEGMGSEIPEEKDVCYLLSDRFRGRLAEDGTLLQRILKTKRERLEIYVPENEGTYYRVDAASGKLYGSLYDSDVVGRENGFDVFFGGERPLTEIYTSAVNGQSLLVIGDREADSIVPRFVSSFEKIIVVHPAKCTETIDQLIKKYQPEKILYLYGANSFMRDRALLRLLGE